MDTTNQPIEQQQVLQQVQTQGTAEQKTKACSLVYTGEKDLSTVTLEKLKGRAFVSKQFIADLAKASTLRQAERDLINDVLKHYSDGAIPVGKFAKQVKQELLPLKRNNKVSIRHQHTVLSSEVRGDITNYGEHIYSSPIITSAGDRHFDNLQGEKKDKYFAHTRTEDIKDNTIRRVIEIQSDLLQKNRLEDEISAIKRQLPVDIGWKIKIGNKNYTVLELFKGQYQPAGSFAKVTDGKKESYLNLYDEQVLKVLSEKRTKEIERLKVYRNSWHEQVIQGEIRQAAKDGKTVLHFPTGDTAKRIENIQRVDAYYDANSSSRLTLETIYIGQEFRRLRGGSHADNRRIIVAIEDNKAVVSVPKMRVEQEIDNALSEGKIIDMKEAAQRLFDQRAYIETFDITQTDADNPIYKFYEKDVQKYLSKYGVTRITDDKGVSWFEIAVDKELAKKPVISFNSNEQLLLSPNKYEQRKQSLEGIRNKGKHQERSINR